MTSQPEKQSKRLQRGAAANYLGISKSKLEKLAVSGGGPAWYRIGQRAIYDTAELDAWLATKRRRSTSDSGQPHNVAA